MTASFTSAGLQSICALVLAITIPFFQFVEAQSPAVTAKIKLYQRKLQADSNFRMVELRQLIPGLTYDLRYATPDNFTGRRWYATDSITFLRLPVAEALRRVEQVLFAQGFTLLIFDAYRPYSVTKRMWDQVQDERYVANPTRGSGHNRGLAVDLTLLRRSDGEVVDMGTSFDHFSDTAHHSFKNLPEEVLKNRQILRQSMEREGFRALETEWWHYSWPQSSHYDLLDLDFADLLKESKKKK